MKKRNIFLLITFLVIITSCNKKQSSLPIQESIVLKIPVNKFQSIKLSDIIAEYKVIPLEFTKESMISGIFKITIHDNLIYILDAMGSQNVLVFNMKGKFMHSISSKGNGPGQMLYPQDFIIVEKEKRIDILAHKKVNSFSLDGTLIKENKTKFSSTKFIRLNENYYFSAPWDDNCLLYKTDKNFKIKDKLLINKKKSASGVIPYCPFLPKQSDSFTYFTMVGDTIYGVTENDSYPARILDFGNYKFDYDNYSLLTSEEKALLIMSKKMDKKEQCLLRKYFETKNHINLHYKIKGNHCGFIYNKNNKTSIHYDSEHLTDDISELDVPGKIPGLIGCDTDNFYLMVAPYHYKSTKKLLKFMNNATNKEKYTLEDIEKLSNNPIILIAKYDV